MKTLKDFTFPEVTKLDLAFGNSEVPYGLLDLAKESGFYNGNTQGNKLFNEWFFSGLKKVPELKDGINEEEAMKALNWTKCFMRSFAPKHEEKEAICALIFNEYLSL